MYLTCNVLLLYNWTDQWLLKEQKAQLCLVRAMETRRVIHKHLKLHRHLKLLLTSEPTSSRAGCKRKRTSAVWNEMGEKFEGGVWKAECNYCHKKFTAGPRSGTTHFVYIWNLVLLGTHPWDESNKN